MANNDVGNDKGKELRKRPLTGTGQAAASLDQAMDALNRRLDAAEAALATIPGKVEIRVPAEQGFALGFERFGEVWRICLVAGQGADVDRVFETWDECSLEQRALIARYLPDLLRAMLDAVKSRQQQVRAAHSAMDEFESLLNAKEGA